MSSLTTAIDNVISFVCEHSSVMTRDEVLCLRELGEELYRLVREANLLDALPQRDKLAAHLNRSGGKPVEFESKANVPGDWTEGEFDGCPDEFWYVEMATLRRLAEEAEKKSVKGATADVWSDFRDGPGGPLLTPKFCKRRLNVSGKELTLAAKKDPSIRKKNPSGRGFVYRYDAVARISDRKIRDD